MSFSITQFGKPLEKSKYTIDLETKTFSSNEDGLVLDFTRESGWTFNTGSNCSFKTSSHCTFKTGPDCSFNTGWDCTFNTSFNCSFKTGSDCSFNTGSYCSFNTDSHCTFKTGPDCSFNTSNNCTFNTGSDCILLFWNGDKTIRKFLDESNYVCLYKKELVEIKDKNEALLNIKHHNEYVRKLCKEILKGD